MRKRFLLFAALLLLPLMRTAAQLSPDALDRASAYARDAGGSAVLVMRDGTILFEDYHNGADAQTATHLHSATKAFWAAVAARALEDGLIASYDEHVANTITEWQNTAAHPGKQLITIRHLLSLSSGLSQDIENIQGSNPASSNIYRYVVDSLRLVSLPGQQFSYGPSHYYAFAVLLQRKLEAQGLDPDPLHYLERNILQPIGLTYSSWIHDPADNPHIPNGCFIVPREWVKFGRLLLQNGSWQGNPVIDSSLVNDLFVADGPNPGHGKFLWLNRRDGYGATKAMAAPTGSPGGFMYHDGENGIIGALGAGKNRMYIIPSENAVVIRQTLMENDSFDDHTFLSLLLAQQGDTRITPVNLSCIDPEILASEHKMTYQTATGDIWLADLDPRTGRFVSGHGKDLLVDTGATSPALTLNGPEFGLSRNGWSVLYTKPAQGMPQILNAAPDGPSFRHTVLTSGPRRHQTALGSKNDTASSVRFLCTIGFLNGLMAWGDTGVPGILTVVDSVDRGVRWIDNTNSFVYVKQTGALKGELALYNTDNATETIITRDGISKSHPYGWHAPEFGGELLVLVMRDGDTRLGIYRKGTAQDWELIRDIEVPSVSSHRYFGSPEPFVAAGKSFISCVIKEEPDVYSAGDVWVFSLDEGQNTRLEMRIKDGLGSVVRTDPESYPGEREVFIYYNVKTPSGVFEIHRAATGIVSTRTASLRVHAVRPSTTDPAIDGNDETHYAMSDRDVPPLNRLLLFFPGTGARPYDYLKFSRTAAQLGYHAIALSYENAQSINFHLCPRTVDTTCHHRARYEIWFGEDRHAGIDVNHANSIVHRLFALLQHLSATHPDEGWDQYYALGGEIRWERIVTAGHSQGGGHAGFGSKYFGVSRVIMFAATDWVSTGRTADWITMPGPTPPERYFGLVHEEDVPIFSTIPITWRDYGMLRFGPIVGIETISPPYNHSHTLTTARPVSDGLRAHNLPIVDFATPSDENGNELYTPVWEYLLRDAATNSTELPPIVSEFSVYPNPAAGMLVIQTTSPSDMRITDLMGREIWNGRVEKLRTVNLSGWTPGMYFIHGGTDVRRILVR